MGMLHDYFTSSFDHPFRKPQLELTDRPVNKHVQQRAKCYVPKTCDRGGKKPQQYCFVTEKTIQWRNQEQEGELIRDTYYEETFPPNDNDTPKR